MIYFLDTNVLIDANYFHFDIGKRQNFWDWLLCLGTEGHVRIPETVYDEMGAKERGINDWLMAHKKVFFCRTQECAASLSRVGEGYGMPFAEEELETLKADPFLIAHAIAARGTVVTNERPNNATILRNKQIPTVCEALGVPCLTLPAFMWEMRHTMPK